MKETIKVFLAGREVELPWNTMVDDLYGILGASKWSTLLLVNGEPRADDSYLEEGDVITWLRITYHESPRESSGEDS
ncbi:MAG: hypothetical protein QI197_04110 [Candidatus Korarchaeota archaeon]|nr:hypothetical protein [Candidatus Korarchaeota archaeon]